MHYDAVKMSHDSPLYTHTYGVCWQHTIGTFAYNTHAHRQQHTSDLKYIRKARSLLPQMKNQEGKAKNQPSDNFILCYTWELRLRLKTLFMLKYFMQKAAM